MTDDDRELVERLAAIDATPRASWVTELRADLDAAWQTEDIGSLDSLGTTTVTLDDDRSAPPEPTSARRGLILVAAAAAVVVAIALVAIRDDPAANVDRPSPPVTSPPRALPSDGPLLPGTYFVDEVSGTPTPRIFATVGAGWSDSSGGVDEGVDLQKGGTAVDDETTRDDESLQSQIGYLSFSTIAAVYADACHWEAGNYQGTVTTLDGLVTALTEQQGWAEVTAPSDISVDGYPGKVFQRTAPTDMSDCSTRIARIRVQPQEEPPKTWPDFRSWTNQGDAGGGWYYEPAQIETLWVLDLDGTLVVISTGAWPEPSAGAPPDFADDVLDSIGIDGAPAPADEPAPTVNMAATTPPRALFGAEGEQLASGTYFVDEVDGTPTPRIVVTIGAAWSNVNDGSSIGKLGPPNTRISISGGFTGDVGLIAFSRPARVYLDACHLSDGFHPGPVTTLDGLVAALSEQRGWVDVTAPSEISVDGYPGKTFQRTAPAELSDCPNFLSGRMRLTALDGDGLKSWQNEDDSNFTGNYYEPSQVETLMVLDIDGTVIVISTNLWAGSSAADRAEFATVLDSIRIDRG